MRKLQPYERNPDVLKGDRIMTVKPALIMLVEDNEDHAELMMQSLKNHNFGNQLIWFITGEAALKYLFDEAECVINGQKRLPDLILLDIKLPGISGLDILRKIKTSALTRRIPTVMLTTSDHAEEVAKCYDYGANSYIAKPVNFDKFQEKLVSLKMYWVLTAELPQPVGVIPVAEEA